MASIAQKAFLFMTSCFDSLTAACKAGAARISDIRGASGGIASLRLARHHQHVNRWLQHIAETLDFALIAVESGKATFQVTPQLKHYNPPGTVHGGWYATLPTRA